MPQFLKAFLEVAQSSEIGQSVSVMHGSRFDSYRIGSDVYHVGDLSLLTQFGLWFSMFPWVVVIFVLIICFIMAVWIRVWLRRKARRRLQATEEEDN